MSILYQKSVTPTTLLKLGVQRLIIVEAKQKKSTGEPDLCVGKVGSAECYFTPCTPHLRLMGSLSLSYYGVSVHFPKANFPDPLNWIKRKGRDGEMMGRKWVGIRGGEGSRKGEMKTNSWSPFHC